MKFPTPKAPKMPATPQIPKAPAPKQTVVAPRAPRMRPMKGFTE